jgi:hypothetical protein
MPPSDSGAAVQQRTEGDDRDFPIDGFRAT